MGEKAASFNGRSLGAGAEMLGRPRTVPNLLSIRVAEEERERPMRLTKLLLNVSVDRSLGEVRLVMRLESTVGDLITAAVKQYKKEGRRPVLDGMDADGFDLHYSPFSLESLGRDEKLITLGSRNFFLFPRKSEPTTESDGNNGNVGSKTMSSCSKQAEKATKIAIPWLKFLF